MKFFLAILPAFLSTVAVVASPLAQGLENVCTGATEVVSESFIGKDNNVKMTTVSCPDMVPAVEARSLQSRQTTGNVTNVCGAACTTNCFIPSGGGPDPNECHVIADALRYDSQSIGAIFEVNNTNTTNAVVMQFSSCKAFFLNQDLGPLAYCRTDFASVIDSVAPNCQATQNAHGGNCVAKDQRWFVQVQHV